MTLFLLWVLIVLVRFIDETIERWHNKSISSFSKSTFAPTGQSWVTVTDIWTILTRIEVIFINETDSTFIISTVLFLSSLLVSDTHTFSIKHKVLTSTRANLNSTAPDNMTQEVTISKEIKITVILLTDTEYTSSFIYQITIEMSHSVLSTDLLRSTLSLNNDLSFQNIFIFNNIMSSDDANKFSASRSEIIIISIRDTNFTQSSTMTLDQLFSLPVEDSQGDSTSQRDIFAGIIGGIVVGVSGITIIIVYIVYRHRARGAREVLSAADSLSSRFFSYN